MSLPTKYHLSHLLPQMIVADGLVMIENEQAWYYPFVVDGERNPALEWQLQYRPKGFDRWSVSDRIDQLDPARHDCRWVALPPVKETNDE